jgi:hypothetical protein
MRWVPAARLNFGRAIPGLRHDSTAERLLWLLAALATAGWLPIVWWYSLPANQHRTHFAFEKVPGGFDSPVLRGTLVLFLALAGIYLGGYVLLARRSEFGRSAKLAIALFIAGPAVANLLLYPVGALDVFDYLVELKLAYWYGQNPYLTTFAQYQSDPFALPAFLVKVPLFYGPVWLLTYGVPAAIVGFGSVVALLGAVKVFNLLLLGVTGIVIVRSQADRRRGWLSAYLYLANPLVLFEAVGNAHNDVLMTLFLVAALVAFARTSGVAAPLLALSALVKFFTAALGPIFLVAALRDRWGWRRLAVAALLSLGVVVVTVAPYWSGGAMLDGLRRATAKSQEMNHVSLLSLAQQAARTQPVAARLAPLFTLGQSCGARSQLGGTQIGTGGATNACRSWWIPLSVRETFVTRAATILFALLALVVAVTVARGRPLEAAAVDTLLLFLLLMTNLYPWNLIPIVALIALHADRLSRSYLFAATALGLAYYPFYVFARFGHHWPELTIHLVLAPFLTLPILIFLGAEVGRFLSKRVVSPVLAPPWRWVPHLQQRWLPKGTEPTAS